MKQSINNVFFSLVAAGLWERAVQLLPYGEIDYGLLLQLAEEQSVVGLIAAGIEYVSDAKPQKKDVIPFIGRTVQLEQRNIAMNNFIGAIVEKMREVGIYTLLVKGQAVAQCYARPLLRSSGDVDFFLNDVNYKRAKLLLTRLASSVDTDRGGNQGMTIDSWTVEIHDSLHCGLSKRIDNVLSELQRETFMEGNVRTWKNGDVQVFLLSVENDILYVFNHFLKHFYKGGLGLRQICDWCRLLWTYRSELNVDLIHKRLKQMGLMSEWKAFGAFAVAYLGMNATDVPLYDNNWKWKRKAEHIKSFVMSVGNMGQNRDLSYFGKYPYVIRKCISMLQRVGDLIRHSIIFPIDSLRFFPKMMFDGVKSAIKGY